MGTGSKPSRFSGGLPTWIVVAVLIAITSAFALPLLIEGLAWRSRTQPIDGGVTTTGRVVEVFVDEGARGGATYRAEVEYVDAAGGRHTITNKAGDQEPALNSAVQISYDPDDPTRAHDLTTGKGVWKWPFWTGVLLLVMAASALGGGLLALRHRKRSPAP